METITITPEELAATLDAAILTLQDQLERIRNAREALDAPTRPRPPRRGDRRARTPQPRVRATRVPQADREASILHLLGETPTMTTTQIAQALGVGVSHVRRILNEMTTRRLVAELPGVGRNHASSWSKR